MSAFESIVGLLLVATALLPVSRRLSLPYPALLAAAGVAVALVPGAPEVRLDPDTALALFVAPALVDAAWDFPTHAGRRLWVPLVGFAVLAVLASTALVAWVGWAMAGLPLAAAVALGAIVAPPDAAAAVAVLGTVSIPADTDVVLKGESLFNDATALLIFGIALSLQAHGGLDAAEGLRLTFAAPGGVLLGFLLARLARAVLPFVEGTLGGTLVQFANAFVVWIAAERLGLSAVLCTVAYSVTLARSEVRRAPPLVRVHSAAVWGAAVFALNVFAFLLMGMQGRAIVAAMPPDRLRGAIAVAGTVVAAVVFSRLAFAVAFNRSVAFRYRRRGQPEPATLRQAVIVGWSGMRGLVTLATAFALPSGFPGRDVVVLTAFAVVLATLVLQGFTLAPLIRLLGLDAGQSARDDLARSRASLAEAAVAVLRREVGPEADGLRGRYMDEGLAAVGEPRGAAALDRHRRLGLAAVAAERDRLYALQSSHGIDAGTFDLLRDELDMRELALQPEGNRRIAEV